MAEAYPKERHGSIGHYFAYRRFLRYQPGVFILLPHIHGSPHDPEGVVTIKRRDDGAFIQFDDTPLDPVFGQEIAKVPGCSAAMC